MSILLPEQPFRRRKPVRTETGFLFLSQQNPREKTILFNSLLLTVDNGRFL